MTEILGWIIVFGVVIAYAAAWAIPTTRPYARKLWGVALIAFGVGVGLVVLGGRKPGRPILETSEEDRERGKDIAGENLGILDAIVDSALEQNAIADAELTRKLVKSDEKLKEYDAQVSAIKKVDDSLERRKALIALVEETKKEA